MPLGKPVAKRYFTITEVSDMLGLNASMLRYWEKEFRQLNPRTNARGKRFYTDRDIATIQEIHRLVKLQGFTLDGARPAASSASAQTSKACFESPYGFSGFNAPMPAWSSDQPCDPSPYVAADEA